MLPLTPDSTHSRSRNRVAALALALFCVGGLVVSLDSAFLSWLLVRVWVFTLAVAPGLALVAACAGYGVWLVPPAAQSDPPVLLIPERVVLAFACGISVTSSLAFGAGMAGVLSTGVATLIVGAGLAAGALYYMRFVRGRSATLLRGEARQAATSQSGFTAGRAFIMLLLVFAAALIGLVALTPPLIFDVTEYHLGAWTQYWDGRSARFVPMPYNFYARFPFPVEAIYFLGLAASPAVDTAPKLFNMACVFACGALAWCLAGRLGGGRTASWLAALLALSHPVMLEVSIDALIDAPMALLVAGSFYAGFLALGIFQSDAPAPNGRLSLVALLLFGTALATKYTVAQIFLLPWATLIFVPLAWRQLRRSDDRRWLLWGCAAAAVPCLLWFGKNLVWYGNPLEPFFQSLFRPDAPELAEREKFYVDSHFPQSPLSAQYWQTLLPRLREFGWVLLAACGGWMFARDHRPLIRFAAIAALAFLLWNTVRDSQNRFLLPLFVMLAAFASVGAQAVSHRAARRAIYAALVLFAAAGLVRFSLRVYESEAVSYALNFAPTARDTDFSEGDEPSAREQFVETNLGDLGRVINRVNRELPADAKLLLVYEARPYLFRPETLYNVVWDDSLLLDLIRPAASAHEAFDLLRQAGITHVLVNRQELLRYIEQYARQSQLLRLGVGPGQDPRLAWLATEHPEDLYPPFYRDRDWQRLRPLVHELLDDLDSQEIIREGQPVKESSGATPEPIDVVVVEL